MIQYISSVLSAGWLHASELFFSSNYTHLIFRIHADDNVCYSLNAGCISLPALLNIKQVMLQRQVAGIWNGKDELPVSKINISFTKIIFTLNKQRS